VQLQGPPPFLKVNMRTYKIVKVEWEDTCNYRGWHDRKSRKAFEALPCVSAGILVNVRTGCVGVTHSVTKGDDVGETIIIARKVIKSITVLSTFKR